MKIRVIVGLLVFCLAIVCYMTLSLPSIQGVSQMTASLLNRPDKGPDIQEFTILPKDYEKVLSLFEDKKCDSSPAKWQILGGVTIKRKFWFKKSIGLYWTGGGLGAFEIDRTYYRGSSDKAIISVLTECHQSIQDQEKKLSNQGMEHAR